MNILILNWRDPKNPKAGGAEKLNVEILKPLQKKGYSVTWYAMGVKGLPSEEIYNKIRIIRYGNIFTHFLYLPFFFLRKKFGKVHVIVDCIHGIGYMTPIMKPLTKKYILICEVALNIWDDTLPFPLNRTGKLFEKLVLFLYKNKDFWTISHSTLKDLRSMGIKKNRITVLQMGFDAISTKKTSKKTNVPTAVFVGRLTRMKGIEDALLAINKINATAKNKWNLQIIGRGDQKYSNRLKGLVESLKLKKNVNFLGFVSEKEKIKKMASAWVVLVPSSREGWGMIVPEANSVGTQVIGYDVPGLREVLPLYSKQNICVAPNHDSLAFALKKIQKPIILKNRPTPGWEKLHNQMQKLIQ